MLFDAGQSDIGKYVGVAAVKVDAVDGAVVVAVAAEDVEELHTSIPA